MRLDEVACHSGGALNWRNPLSLLLAFMLLLAVSSLRAEPVDLGQGWDWQYRWGDSPFTAGVPRWTVEPEAGVGWRSIDFPSNPPGRDGAENVWYRTTLPEGEWRDPVLYIYSVDLIVQAYVDGKMIYQYGRFDQQGRGEFAGWPWHMITLPADSAGKPIYFRVFSNYLDIGLWGEVKVMERTELLRYIIDNSVEGMLVAGFSLLIALLALVFALLNSGRRIFIAVALYSLATAGLALEKTPAHLLLLYKPLLWNYISAISYYLTPMAMALLLEQWFESPVRRLYNLVWKFHLLFAVLAVTLSLIGVMALAHLYPIFDSLFAITLVLLFVPTLKLLHHADGEQKAIVAAYGLLGALLLIDMAVAYGVLPWGRVPVSWGSLVFSLCVVVIALRFYVRAQRELTALNSSLEQQVRERTEALEKLSYEDPLTGLKNRRYFDDVLPREVALARRQQRPLSLLMCDIDNFKQFNDRYGHTAGDEALRLVARKMLETFRQSDIACRYGGEEFVIVMPDASSEDALMRAEALRRAVSAEGIVLDGENLDGVTLSAGIASWPESVADAERLLASADRALYQAKRGGRDRVESVPLAG
ncbi:GGDEF domain-containing protein [Marinobacterium sp. D7]|nr:GGDEF domain-containing protein [Marinobacterium ramblicola]